MLPHHTFQVRMRSWGCSECVTLMLQALCKAPTLLVKQSQQLYMCDI